MLYVVGSLNVDLVAYMPAFPAPGETVHGTSFLQCPGGKGANQAAAAARLCAAGEAVAMVGAVGDDALGRDYLAPGGVFAASGVDTSRVAAVGGASTGVAPIFVNGAGENCIVVVAGANGTVSAGQVEASLAGLRAGGGVLAQLEVPLAATRAALRAGARAGAPTFFTPAPAPAAGLPSDLLADATVLIPNEGEARALLGGGGGAAALPLADVAAALAARGAQAVVVTRGAQGALVVCAAASGRAPLEVPSPRVRAVADTTGAGDCFSGALAYFYTRLCGSGGSGGGGGGARVREEDGRHALDYEALVEATRRAVVVAALSVTRKGAQTSYAPRAELPQALFDEGSGWRQSPPALPTEV
jgi:ribokinase